MEWLITTKASADLGELDSKLAQWDCQRTGTPPVPLGAGEQVIEASGPRDLPEKARGERAILKVSPSSRLTLY